MVKLLLSKLYTTSTYEQTLFLCISMAFLISELFMNDFALEVDIRSIL